MLKMCNEWVEEGEDTEKRKRYKVPYTRQKGKQLAFLLDVGKQQHINIYPMLKGDKQRPYG